MSEKRKVTINTELAEEEVHVFVVYAHKGEAYVVSDEQNYTIDNLDTLKLNSDKFIYALKLAIK
jgi:environmental stress-induced protein Ves